MEVTELCVLMGDETFEFAVCIHVLGLAHPILGTLQQQKCIGFQSWRTDVRCQQDHALSRKNPPWPLPVPGGPGHSLGCRSITAVSASVSLWPLSLRLCVSFPVLQEYQPWQWPPPHTVGPHRSLTTYLQRPYSQKDHILRFPVGMHFGEILFISPYSDTGIV